MAKMAKTIDGFTQHQTRLAVVIDGLDSCEQDKVLQMLDTVSEGQGSGVKSRRGKDKICVFSSKGQGKERKRRLD